MPPPCCEKCRGGDGGSLPFPRMSKRLADSPRNFGHSYRSPQGLRRGLWPEACTRGGLGRKPASSHVKFPRRPMRDPLFWIPVKIKLPFAFVAVCAVTFLMGGYLVSISQATLEKQIHTFLQAHAASTAAIIDQQLELIGRRVEDFASDGFIRSHLERLVSDDQSPASKAALSKALRHHIITNKLALVDHFVAARVLDAEEACLFSIGTQPTPPEGSGRSEGLWYGSLEFLDGEQEAFPSFTIAAPVRRLDGSARLGTLQIVVRADVWIDHLLKRQLVTNEKIYRLSLTDQANHRLPFATSSLWQKPEAPGRLLSLRTALKRNGWTLEVEVAKGLIMQPVQSLRWQVTVISCSLLCLVLAFVYFPTRYLVKPLGELETCARSIASGDFDTRMFLDSKDEIGSLSRAFNFMADAVETRTRKLEEAALTLERREAEIRTERDRLNSLIGSMKDGLFILDRSDRVALSNAAARPVIESLRETGALGPCAGRGGGSCFTCLSSLRASAHFCEVQVGPRVFEIHGSLLASADGSTTERLFVTRDITERKAEAERQAHSERMAVLGQVAAVMAHELNNPLSAIAMFSQMLEGSLEPDSSNYECAQIIRRNTLSCKETIRRLLGSTAPASPEFSELCLAELIESVKFFLQPLYHRAGAELQISIDADQTELAGDQLQLRQVFTNLLMNAIQTEEPGGKVEIKVRENEGGLVVSVMDNGPGIPSEVLDHIFTPFFTTKPPGIGTGLGLSISRRIVEDHSGSLELIESRPGQTEFRIELPRQPSRTTPTPTAPMQEVNS